MQDMQISSYNFGELWNTGARNVELGTEANRHAITCGFEMLFVIKYFTT